MLVLPISASFGLLGIVWAISFSFLGTSILLCFAIVIRRYWRNRGAARRNREQEAFQVYLAKTLNSGAAEALDLRSAPDCQIDEMNSVFLHYFRTLKGNKLEHLQDRISCSDIEDQIVESAFKGIRGTRMQAVRTLSYLNSQKSLRAIFENLLANDKYVRLTAARCLVRRKSECYLTSIIEALTDAFPQDYKLLAGILAGYDRSIIKPLENIITKTENDTVKTACLEALILIMPARTALNIAALMNDPSETVRAATLSLASIAAHSGNLDPLKLGLTDSSIAVKIRAAKLAATLKRSDLTTELYKLVNDPVMWVRYWALRAIWVSGQSGQRFVESLSNSEPMAANVDQEMRSGYV